MACVLASVIALLVAGCEDRRLHGARPGSPPKESSSKLEGLLPEAPIPSAATTQTAEEGAESAEAVFARAQSLLDKKDFLSLVYTIRVDTRRRWTADLVVAVALESIDDGTDSDIGRRAARERARRLLETFGATASMDEHSGVNVAVLQKRLFQHVRDPDGLLAAMLAFADSRDCGVDPLCALGPSGIDGVVRPEESRASRPGMVEPPAKSLDLDAGLHLAPHVDEPTVSVAAGGIARLFRRVRTPHKLGEVSFDGSAGVGMTEAPGFAPVRFYKKDGITWLDES